MMFGADQSCHTQDVLLSRLRDFIGQVQTRVGTPLADALASALQVDRRLYDADDGLQRHLALSKVEVLELAFELNFALDNRGEFLLPLGAKVVGVERGSVEIDGECLVLDCACAGLFSLELTPPDAHGPNLTLLRSEIERMTRKLACRRIGLPSAATHIYGDVRRLLRFEPFGEGGDVQLQRSAMDTGAARFCAASPIEIRSLAADIILDMRTLWSNRKSIAEQANQVRRAAERAAACVSSETRVKSIVIEMSHQRKEAANNAFFYLEYQDLDEAMRPGTQVQHVLYTEALGDEFNRLSNSILGRKEELAQLRAAGADGRIDDMALGALRAAPEGASAVLERLATSYETVVTIAAGNKPLYATLYWRRGCIEAELSSPGKLLFLNGRLDLPHVNLPESVMDLLPGRKLSDVVELPFGSKCVIYKAKKLGPNGICLTLNTDTQMINLRSGEVWTDDLDINT